MKRKSTEQEARSLINFTLKNLGWFFEGKNQNVFQENAKFQEEKKKLNLKRPDYLLYNNDNILAIIEAKKKYGNFEIAKEDGFKKAQSINCPIVFVSDNDFIEAYSVEQNKKLYRNGRPLSEFLSLTDLLEYKSKTEIDNEKIIDTNKELQSIFKNADNILRSVGIQQGLPRLAEIYNVLFIKLLFDLEKEQNITNDLNWDDLLNRQGEDLINTFNKLIENYNANYNNVLVKKDADLNGEALKGIIELFDGAGNLAKVETDIKGEAFEYFLKKYQDTHDDMAQYFTPRHVVKFLVWLAKPKFGDKIFDPFCGTGGMLIESFKYIKIRTSDLNKTNLNKLRNDTVWGQDNSASSRVAKMNMILAGDGHSNIKRKDTFKTIPERKFDFVITNIPFNLNPNPRENNLKCINFCIESLKKTGRAYIIVPYSIMNNEYKDYRDNTIEPILEKFIKLPRFTFSPYTNATSLILVLNKEKQNNYIEYFEINNDGFSKNQLREPNDKNDIEKLQKGLVNFEKVYKFDEVDTQEKIKNGTPLIDFLIPIEKKIKLEPSKIYAEPKISGNSNTVSARKERLGRNMKKEYGKLIKKGNLLISTLHTQNGLFAIADREYIGASQLVYKINEKRINKDVLFFLLNKEIRKLKKSDVVGRETYKKEEIENILIPPITKEVRVRVKKKIKLEDEIKSLQRKLEEINNN